MHRFLPAAALLFHLFVYGQIDQKKADSLARAIDSSAKAHKAWQDSFAKAQDSIYQTAIKENNSRKAENFSSVQKEKQAKGKQAILRILIGVVLLIVLVILLLRRRKAKT